MESETTKGKEIRIAGPDHPITISPAGIQGDVARLADLDRLYENVAKAKGQIDIVFANAGVGEFVPFGGVTEEHFGKLFNINVRGTLFTIQKALPLLKDGGSIILNGSVASVKGSAASRVYAASKAAIRSFDLLANPEVIPGAQRIPPREVLDNPSLIPRDRDVVVYCACSGDKTSRTVLRRARLLGFSRIKLLRGGVVGLESEGLRGGTV